jgi:hypothetical protein
VNIHVLLCGDAFTGPALPRGSYERLAQMLYPVQRAKLECTKKMTRGFYQYAVRHCLFAVTHRIRSGGEDRPYQLPVSSRSRLSVTSPDRMRIIPLAFLVIPHHTHQPCSTHPGEWVGPP